MWYQSRRRPVGETVRKDLARHLAPRWRVICPDTIGRGLSQWSTEPDRDYRFAVYARTAQALLESPYLAGFTGRVADSGEGRWTIDAAIDESVPAPVLTAALYARFRSRQDHTFADKLLSALRRQFGGHVEKK